MPYWHDPVVSKVPGKLDSEFVTQLYPLPLLYIDEEFVNRKVRELMKCNLFTDIENIASCVKTD